VIADLDEAAGAETVAQIKAQGGERFCADGYIARRDAERVCADSSEDFRQVNILGQQRGDLVLKDSKRPSPMATLTCCECHWHGAREPLRG